MKVCGVLRTRPTILRAIAPQGIYQGKLEVDGPKIHTVVAHVGSQLVVEYHFWLAIRSTQPGASNRLDIRSFVSVDEGEEARAPDTRGPRVSSLVASVECLVGMPRWNNRNRRPHCGYFLPTGAGGARRRL